MLWVGKIPRTIGTTAAVYAVYNQLGGILAYPHVWVQNCLLVVFGNVSRILDISRDISNDIDTILHVNIHQK